MALTTQQQNDLLELLSDLSKLFKYAPYIYREAVIETYNTANPLDHLVKFKENLLDEKTVMFFIPSTYAQNSDGGVRIGFLKPGEGYTVTNNTKFFNLKIEQGASYVPLKAKDFYTNRVFMLRKFDDNDIVVINYRADANVIFETLTVHELEIPENGDLTIEVDDTNRSLKQLIRDHYALKEEVDRLSNQIKIGTAAPEQELAEEPAGTIYIKVEDL
jgi:hypothetical protein